jgi:hypothetical protein
MAAASVGTALSSQEQDEARQALAESEQLARRLADAAASATGVRQWRRFCRAAGVSDTLQADDVDAGTRLAAFCRFATLFRDINTRTLRFYIGQIRAWAAWHQWHPPSGASPVVKATLQEIERRR